MGLGIFARTFQRPTLEANLDAVAAHGCKYTQYNLICAGLPTLPDSILPDLCERIRLAHRERSLQIAAISGTFNIIDPDRSRRAANTARFEVLAEAAAALEAPVITVCTGTRDAEDLWRGHPENSTHAAWLETLDALGQLAAVGERLGVDVAFEPEPSNIITSARKARQALDHVGRSRLKVVFDAANLLQRMPSADCDANLAEALQLLAKETAVVHIKPLDNPLVAADAERQFSYVPALLRGLGAHGCKAPLILHAVAEPHVATALAYVRRRIGDVAPSLGNSSG